MYCFFFFFYICNPKYRSNERFAAKIDIEVSQASSGAIEAIEKAGGTIKSGSLCCCCARIERLHNVIVTSVCGGNFPGVCWLIHKRNISPLATNPLRSVLLAPCPAVAAQTAQVRPAPHEPPPTAQEDEVSYWRIFGGLIQTTPFDVKTITTPPEVQLGTRNMLLFPISAALVCLNACSYYTDFANRGYLSPEVQLGEVKRR